MTRLSLLILLISISSLFSQDFFSSASADAGSRLLYELNGFVRGAIFGGQVVGENKAELKSGYGELGLKFRARKGHFGAGFAEVRLRSGSEFNEPLSEVRLREAYVNIYPGKFDLQLGHQIVVWGRADGFNPTNNITPQNMLTRSTDEDDRRQGNFLLRSSWYWHPLRFEFIWVPQYVASVLPTGLLPFPDYVKLGEAVNPDANLKNSSLAVKLNGQSGILDGSVSWFQGYMPMPGIFLSNLEFNEKGQLLAVVKPKPYKMNVIGFDFASTFQAFGLRGEFAWRKPVADYQSPDEIHIPNPDFQYVLGIDKSKGDLSVILQYIGRYVTDFNEVTSTGSPTDELELKNRMIASQQDEISHALFIRPALVLLHETLELEALAYYNMTTEESLFRPVVNYDLADALTVKMGAEWYSGPENTLFGNIDEALSSIFVEFRAAF